MKIPAPKPLVVAAALLSLLVLGTATAQQDMGNAATAGATYATGVVAASTPDSLTLTKDDGESMTLLVEPATVGASSVALHERARDSLCLRAGRGGGEDENDISHAQPTFAVVRER